MKDIIFRDYASWKLENQELLETFESNDNSIYERFEPVYVVLDHIYEMVCDGSELDEDLQIIFETGFAYLSNQLEVIKIYFETLFQKKCDDFIEFSDMILYLIYIADFRADLENNGFESDIPELDELETTIENLIMERNKDYAYVSNLMNETLGKIFDVLDYEYVSIVDIFVEIAENLGIFLYEEQEYVLGTDI